MVWFLISLLFFTDTCKLLCISLHIMAEIANCPLKSVLKCLDTEHYKKQEVPSTYCLQRWQFVKKWLSGLRWIMLSWDLYIISTLSPIALSPYICVIIISWNCIKWKIILHEREKQSSFRRGIAIDPRVYGITIPAHYFSQGCKKW